MHTPAVAFNLILVVALVGLAACSTTPVAEASTSKRTPPPVPPVILAALPTYAALEAALEADLAQERARPPETRAVLRGQPTPGDALEQIDRARHSPEVPELSKPESDLFARAVWSHVAKDELPPELPPGLERLRAALAPSVAAVRSAIRAERITPPFDLGREAIPGAPRFDPRDRLRELEVGFALESVRVLREGNARESAAIGLDLFRMQDDLERDTRDSGHEFGLSTPVDLITVGFRSQTGDALEEIDRELAILERTQPSLGAVVRARRLEGAVVSRARAREAAADDADFADLTDLPPEVERLGPADRRTAARVRVVARDWEKTDRVLRMAEKLLDTLSPPLALAQLAPEERVTWVGAEDRALAEELRRLFELGYGNWLEKRLARLESLRELRVLVAARRFERAHSAWPATIDDALGRAPGESEQSPFDGQPLALHRRGGRLAVAVRGPVRTRSEVSVSIPIGVVEASGGDDK